MFGKDMAASSPRGELGRNVLRPAKASSDFPEAAYIGDAEKPRRDRPKKQEGDRSADQTPQG
jgi:hypothetical protein